MPAEQIKAGTTDIVRYVVMRSSVDGSPLTGLTVTEINLQSTVELAASATKIDAIVGTGGATTHVDDKVFEMDATDSPGLYMVCWRDVVFGVGNVGKKVILTVTHASATPAVEEIILTADDMADLRDEFDADPITCSDVTGAVGSVTGAVGSVTGAVGSVTAEVTADMTKIGGDSVAGNVATLTLKQLDIQNSAGTALVAKSTGGAGHGMELLGNGAGEGLSATGGASSGHGILAAGGGTGSGLIAVGGGTGSGIKAQGGSTSGDGIECVVVSGAEFDADITGDITGNLSGSVGSVTAEVTADMTKIGGDSVAGNVATLTLKQLDIQNSAGSAFIAKSTGGAGHGMDLAGNSDGVGIKALGGAAANGVLMQGQGNNNGLQCTGQGFGDGINAQGGTNGHGILAAGGGTGSGLRTQAGATGIGLEVLGGAVSGDGIDVSVTSGIEIDANITGDITGNLSGSVGSVTADVVTDAASRTASKADVSALALEATVDALNDPTVGAIADAVWDEALGDHAGVGSTGEALDAADATADVSAIADAVWDEVLTDGTHDVDNSAGKRLRQVEAAVVVHSGTAQAGSTATTIKLDTGASTTDNIYRGDRVVIVGGTGVEESGIISSYVGSTRVASMSESWVITPNASSKFEIVPAIAGRNDTSESSTAALTAALVWDNAKSGHVAVGSFGEEVQSHGLSSEISALNDISTADLDTALATYDGPTKAELDSGLAALNDPTAAAIADAVWDETLSEHAGVGSTGEALDAADATADVSAIADAVWDEAKAGHVAGGSFGEEAQLHALSTDISALNDPTAVQVAAAVWDAASTGHPVGSTGDVLLDAADASAMADAVWDEAKAGHVGVGSMGEEVQAHALSSEVSALNDLSAAQVNAECDTALTDYDAPTKAELDSGLAGLNDPTAAVIADAVWDEALGDHAGVGSTGEALDAADTTADAGAIADAVWDEAKAGHVGVGSMGEEVQAHSLSSEVSALNDLSAAQVNAECDTALTDYDAATGAEVAALNDPTAAVIADAVWDEAKAGHVGVGSMGEEVQAHALSTDVSALNDLSAAQVNAECDTALTDYDAPTKAELDAGLAGLNDPTAAAISDAVWDEALGDHAGVGSTGEALDAADATADVSAIADAIWDEAKAGHVGVGSFGEEVQLHGLSSEISALNDISTGDVATELATYDGPTKAEMDAAHASLATAANLTTVDTVVDAIKVKTDGLNFTGADVKATLDSETVVASSVTGAVGSVTGNVGGNVVGTVGSVVGAVGSVGAGGITAATFAADAIDAAALATDAVEEIRDAIYNGTVDTFSTAAASLTTTATLKQVLSLMLSVISGTTADTGVTFKTPDATSTRVAATLGGGDRTAMVLTPST